MGSERVQSGSRPPRKRCNRRFRPRLEMKIDPQRTRLGYSSGRAGCWTRKRAYRQMKEKHALPDRGKKQKRRDPQKKHGVGEQSLGGVHWRKSNRVRRSCISLCVCVLLSVLCVHLGCTDLLCCAGYVDTCVCNGCSTSAEGPFAVHCWVHSHDVVMDIMGFGCGV